MKTKRLEILENSLKKKNEKFDAKLDEHFASVKATNGQPLNDKRNGAATLNQWERQNESLRTAKREIEKTERAIEREIDKIESVEYINTLLPEPFLKLVESGKLVQWRKHPNTFFVPNVDKARFTWDFKKKTTFVKYVSAIPNEEQKELFRAANKELYALMKEGGYA